MSLFPSFARPRSLAQASELLASLTSGKIIIAGGQEIMPSVNTGVLQPDVYVDIGSLRELHGITIDEESGMLAIGALTVHRELQTHALVHLHAPLLAESARQAGGGRQVHNRGTIGGNIVAMHPLYDIAPALLALQAELEMLKDGELTRTPLSQVLTDTNHGLGSDAILVRVLLRPMNPNAGSSYEKLKMSGGAYGSANAAAIIELSGSTIASVRLCVGAVAEQLIDASAVAAFLSGSNWTDDAAEKLKAAVSALVTQPLSDQQGAGDWRTAMAGVVAARACAAAVKNAQSDGAQ
ncbi:MAG: carbon-monoxide dehydrogenase medium subunit [Halieaceae bacterium]|jgi:carbon-monoxide dehydrogenase medium subunit